MYASNKFYVISHRSKTGPCLPITQCSGKMSTELIKKKIKFWDYYFVQVLVKGSFFNLYTSPSIVINKDGCTCSLWSSKEDVIILKK